MAVGRSDRKAKMTMPDGKVIEGIEVGIHESSEPWSEYHLDDGTIVRVKSLVSSVVRVDGQYDQEGNPVYVVKTTSAVSIVDVPEALKKKS